METVVSDSSLNRQEKAVVFVVVFVVVIINIIIFMSPIYDTIRPYFVVVVLCGGDGSRSSSNNIQSQFRVIMTVVTMHRVMQFKQGKC
jgi:hypothetical protein